MILTHGIEVWNIRKKFKLIALSKARIIVSVSRYTIYRIREQLSGVAGRNYLLPNTVDTERFKPDKKLNSLVEQYNLSGYRVILTVARLDYNDRDKGYDKVIYALAKVIAEIPNVKYLLVGKGDDIRRIHRLVDSLGLNAYVILTGFISNDELPSYYNLCDLFIMPSLQEGFGIVFLEALACGKPVIGGNRDGTRDAFLDGRLGVLIDPDDTNQISDAIVRILRREVNSDLLDANFLRGAVIENFGLEHFKRQVFELLDYVS